MSDSAPGVDIAVKMLYNLDMPTALRLRQKAVPSFRYAFPQKGVDAKVAFLQFLPTRKLSLRMPLAVTIEYTPKITIVSNADLELFGYGDTESEAIQDFTVSFEELYFWLKKEKKRLSKNLKEKYRFLTQVVSEK